MTSGAQHVVAIVRQVLEDSSDGLLVEVLERQVATQLGRPVSRRSLQDLLVRNPSLFALAPDGRWSLVRQEVLLEPEVQKTQRNKLVPGDFVVFDLETVGKEAEGEDTEIIEIALAQFESNQLVDSWQTYVRPTTPIPPLISELTSIRDEDVVDSPLQAEAIGAFFHRVRGLPVIAHNGTAFDGAVLRSVAERVGVSVPEDFLLLDTLPLARAFHQQPGQHHTNEDLASLYGCHRPGAHRAGVDVQMLSGVVLGLLGEPNRHPLGPLIYELLRRAADPWSDLLEVPRSAVDLDRSMSLLGKAQAKQLPLRRPASDSATNPTAIDAVFEEIQNRGRDRREPQVRLAQLVAEGFNSGRFAVVEAGTGTGKGLGYLVPAALLARSRQIPVVVSTYTRVLQSQLLEKDVAFLQELMPNVTAAVLKGRGNYLSLSRLRDELIDAFDEDHLTRARAWTLATVASFSLTTPDGDLESLWPAISAIEDAFDAHGEAHGLFASLRSSTTSDADTSGTPSSLDFYDLALDNAKRADILVVNHSLLLARATPHAESELISPFLICDEAHNLEDAATNALKEEVEEVALNRLLNAVYDEQRRTGLLVAARRAGVPAESDALESARSAHGDTRIHAGNLGRHLRTFVEANTIASRDDRARYGASVELRRSALAAPGGPALRESAHALIESLAALRTALDGLVDECVSIAEANGARRAISTARSGRALNYDMFELERTLRWFWTFAEASTHVRAIGVRLERAGVAAWRLEGVPIDVSAVLHERLWSRLESAAFCSATLSTYGDSFGFFLRRTGLSRSGSGRVITESLPTVFDYPRDALLALPSHLPTPRDQALKKEFPRAVAAELARFVTFFRGRTLGLFTAGSRMRFVHDLIAEPLRQRGYPVLCQGDGAVAKLREEFEQRPEVSLLGLRSFWEGIDVPGRSLSFVVMSKLPFPSLGDPIENARMSAVERAGGSGFYDYFLPRTIFTFKQGFGRLLRAKQDRGAVILLDKRLRGATYRPDVLRSLPGPTVSYDSDVDMYRRICDFLGEPFDADLLPPIPLRDADRFLSEHTLDRSIYSTEEFQQVVLPVAQAALRQLWGFEEFKGSQLEIIQAVMTGNDVMALLPTGAGKSLTFQLPALLRPGLTLVVSPLVALIRDQVEKLRYEAEIGFVNCLVSGMTAMDQEQALVEARNGQLRLLYVSPERLRDPRFRAFLPELPLVQLVIDEAHCISTWGHDFRPDFLEITSLLPATRLVPIQALTATAPPEVRDDIDGSLHLGQRGFSRVEIISDFGRPNLVFRVYRPQAAAERDSIAMSVAQQIVADPERGGPGIVYVATRREAERLAALLRGRNIAAQAYHAGLSTETRHHVQELFMQGEIQVVVATNAFGMGVDKQEIRFVLHYDHPSSVEAYVQESGRAGRDGREAYAILLYSTRTQRTQRFLARKNLPAPRQLQEVLAAISSGDFDGGFRLPDGSVLCSFERLSAAIGVEEAAARVIVHALESVGAVERREDFTLAGTILPNVAPEQLMEHLSDEDAELFGATVDRLHLEADSRASYRAFEIAQLTGRHPAAVEGVLHRAARAGDLIFRGFERGITLRLQPGAHDSTRLDEAARAFGERLARFNSRLQKMIMYANLRAETGGCRAAFLIDHLTGESGSQRCGRCDLCAPDYPVPWTAAAIVAPEPLEVEPAMAVLEAVRDHDAIYGLTTLVKLLLGEAFGAGYELTAYQRNSPHFGVLKGKARAQQVRATIEQLLGAGALRLIDRQRSGEGGVYSAPRLTELGRDILGGAVSIPGPETVVGA